MMTKTKALCWENGPFEEDGCSTTCMLLHGHDGPHKWTRDDQIFVQFATKTDDDLPPGPRSMLALGDKIMGRK